MLIDEGDISNYLGVKIKKNQMGHSNYHNRTWWKKIINDVQFEVSASILKREMPNGKLLLHKDKYSIGRKFMWDYG